MRVGPLPSNRIASRLQRYSQISVFNESGRVDMSVLCKVGYVVHQCPE